MRGITPWAVNYNLDAALIELEPLPHRGVQESVNRARADHKGLAAMGRQMENAVDVSVSRGNTFDWVVDDLPIAVTVAERNGSFVFYNREAERIMGPSRNGTDLGGPLSSCRFYFPDKETPYLSHHLPLVRAICGEAIRDELVFLRSPSHCTGLWLRASGRPLVSSRDGCEGAVMIYRDVTEQRQALERMCLLSRAVEQTADSIIITDATGVIEYVNSAFEITTGYSRFEVLGKKPNILKSGRHDTTFYRALWEWILQGKSFRGTLVNRKKDGELYWAEQTISSMRDEAGAITHFVSVLKDITELKNKHEHEAQARLAREVQQSLYPTTASAPGLDVAAFTEPAYETGGDYVDFIPSANGLYVCIGDVSGHGSGPALVMALTRAYMRSMASMGLSVDEVLRRTNQLLVPDLKGGHFVTVLLLRVEAGTNALSYASAGHVPGFVLGNSGHVEAVLESSGVPLGLFADSQFRANTIWPSRGATVLLLTDGITEMLSFDGSELGVDRVLDLVRSRQDQTARQIVDAVCFAVKEFGRREHKDDVTAIVIKMN